MKTSDLRIAIVDDNREAVTALAKVMTKSGFNVVAQLSEPTSAFDQLAEEHPHVVILDIGMPFIDGYTLANRLREHLVPNPRLIAVTGYGTAEDKAQARDSGFDAHFTKPVDWPKLEALLMSYLNQK